MKKSLSASPNTPSELIEIEKLAQVLTKYGDVKIETTTYYRQTPLPIYSFSFGGNDLSKPVIIFVGGVHGLERIGSRVAIAYLQTLQELLFWDCTIEALLERCRIVFYPLANPGGVLARTRCNPNGVDLMRNAPLDADTKPNVLLVGGHHISPKLPWYRGVKGAPMELESQTLCDFVDRNIADAEFALSLDFHSGFGVKDRLWFPYAGSSLPFSDYKQMYALKRKMDQVLPNHIYCVEPQSNIYVTHGDLWDFLHRNAKEKRPETTFLPLTLEMGSWRWVKKNPAQIFTSLGPFNPIKPHRTQRTLRRHIALIDFLIRATASYKRWMNPPSEKAEVYRKTARHSWYPNR